MRTCLYFGSFNPIHQGHLGLAEYMLEHYGFDEVLFVLSPLNPQKQSKDMLSFEDRADLIRSCISSREGMALCTLEQVLPRPYYTIRTLNALKLLNPQHDFCLLMGSDNYLRLQTWFAFERLADYVELYVYPRTDYELSLLEPDFWSGKLNFCLDAPLKDLASSQIREAFKSGDVLADTLPKELSWQAVAKLYEKHNHMLSTEVSE